MTESYRPSAFSGYVWQGQRGVILFLPNHRHLPPPPKQMFSFSSLFVHPATSFKLLCRNTDRLGELNSKANIFGKSSIHRSVLHLEIAGAEQVVRVIVQRVLALEEVIKEHDKKAADSKSWNAIAQNMHAEIWKLHKNSLAKQQPEISLENLAGLSTRK